MKLKTLYTYCLISIPLVSSGCAVISENECQAGLWYERGVQDGNNGFTRGTVYEIAQKCQEYGVHVDSAAWVRGHREGLNRYCRPEHGFQLGRKGKSYSDVCRGPDAYQFVLEYQRGIAEYEVEQRYYALQSRYQEIEYELEEVKDDLQAARKKKGAKKEIKDLKKRRRNLQDQLNNIEWEMGN